MTDVKTNVYIGGPMGVFGTGIPKWRAALHRYGAVGDALEMGGDYRALIPHEQFLHRYPTYDEVDEYVNRSNYTPLDIYNSDMQILNRCQTALCFLDKPSHGVGAEIALMCKKGIVPFMVIFDTSYYSKFIEGMLRNRYPKIADSLELRIQSEWNWSTEQTVEFVVSKFKQRMDQIWYNIPDREEDNE